MSAAQHDAMARAEDRSAAEQAVQHDPNTAAQATRCPDNRAPCWSSVLNPTAAQVAEADRHRKLAAEHRAASQALRDAEARACVGLTDADRDMSPFMHREDIASVQELVTKTTVGKSTSPRQVGAVVALRAVPGLTAQWLQRVVDCHLARNAALGHNVPEMPYCPLVPNGVAATVAPTATGFAVEVRSDDTAVAQEILRRAQGLVAH
jgi:hypothetical protein